MLKLATYPEEEVEGEEGVLDTSTDVVPARSTAPHKAWSAARLGCLVPLWTTVPAFIINSVKAYFNHYL